MLNNVDIIYDSPENSTFVSCYLEPQVVTTLLVIGVPQCAIDLTLSFKL